MAIAEPTAKAELSASLRLQAQARARCVGGPHSESVCLNPNLAASITCEGFLFGVTMVPIATDPVKED